MKGEYNNSNNNGEINMFYFKFLKNNQKKTTSKSQELKYFFNVD